MTIHLNLRLVRLALLMIGVIGLLAVIYGIYRVIDTTNQYSVLAAIAPPSASELQNVKPGDPTIMALAAVERDKRDLLSQRAQASSLIGAGAAILGLAVLVYMRLPPEISERKEPHRA